VRRRTGVLLQRSGFSGDLTVRETLELWAATLTAPRPVDEMLALLALEGRADVRMRACPAARPAGSTSRARSWAATSW
jgi:ABC-2 type transport system ATP-binding protein